MTSIFKKIFGYDIHKTFKLRNTNKARRYPLDHTSKLHTINDIKENHKKSHSLVQDIHNKKS